MDSSSTPRPSRRDFLKAGAALAAAAGVGPLWSQLRAADAGTASPALEFPPGFRFGVASAAYQIEGGWNADGKGESIWDRWCHTGRAPVSADVACDHYHRYRDDVGLLQTLGVDAYRFSIAWTRILPDGTGAVNPAGVAYYRDLLRRLKAAGIKPAVTLYHWDLPQKLEEQGGWTNRATVAAFERYARLVFAEFGDDVDDWITFNEPWVTAFVGHWMGKMAPGRTDLNAALQVAHHLLLAHGRAVQAFRETKRPGRIGITLDLFYGFPATEQEADRRAAEMINQSHMDWFADPIFHGRYPEMVCEQYRRHGHRLPVVEADDFAVIRQPIDFVGLNYYNADTWSHDPQGWLPYEVRKVAPAGETLLQPTWRPDGLLQLLRRVHGQYGAPEVFITENGLELPDHLNHRGEVHDDARIEYIQAHLQACRRALDEGIKVRGYFVWSFLDDYEWGNFGRLGLVHVDFATLARTIKRSGRWYADSIRARRFTLP